MASAELWQFNRASSMDPKEFSKWSRRVAVWIPRLADPGSLRASSQALHAIGLAFFKACHPDRKTRKGKSISDKSDEERSSLYKSAINRLEGSLDHLIPLWIDRLIDNRREIQLQTDARVAASKNNTEMPGFQLGGVFASIALQHTLTACGEYLDPHLDPLIAAINTTGRDGDNDLAEVLSHAGSGILRARAALFTLLRSHGVWSRPSGIRSAMARLAEFDNSVVLELKVMLHGADEKIRAAATAVIGSLGDAGRVATDDLVAMESLSIGERCSALYALAAQRPATPAVLDLLERALRDENGYVRRAAVSTIGRVRADPPRFVPQLIEACDDTASLHDETVQDTAVLALKEFGPAAVTALPRLKQFIDGPIAGRSVKR